MGVNLRGRSFLKLLDFSTDEINYLLDLSADFKRMKRAGVPLEHLRCLFVTHGHSDHILGAIWVIRKIASLMNKDFSEGEFHIYCHDVACEIIEMVVSDLFA